MGILNNLFGKKDKFDMNKLNSISEILDEDKFWNIINTSKLQSENQEQQEELIRKKLSELPLNDIAGFHLMLDKLLFDTYTSHLWCAAYIIKGGCSDDSFDYFRYWLIAQGREIFEKAIRNPDSLVDILDDTEEYDFETLGYIANDVFETKTQKDVYDYIDYDNFTTQPGNYPEMEFDWDEDNPESMKAICPQLFDACWDNYDN